MTLAPLACSVRGCHQPLTRRGAAYACDRGHTFDIARSGYLNLLQPQDRRSRDARRPPQPPWTPARACWPPAIGASILAGFVDARRAALETPADAVVLDLGCGTGEAAGARRPTVTGAGGIGIDISVDAIDARRAALHRR